jgi:hypothetical protein
MFKGADGRRPSCLTCEPPPAKERRREPSPASSMTGCLLRPAGCRVAVTGAFSGTLHHVPRQAWLGVRSSRAWCSRMRLGNSARIPANTTILLQGD